MKEEADNQEVTEKEPEFNSQKILNIFGSSVSRTAIIKAEADGSLPVAKRIGKSGKRVWSYDDIPIFGERYGFLKKPDRPSVITLFATKGGILKTTLAVNIARMAALHNIKTLVIGLDMQCDLTSDLGYGADISENDSLDEALQKLGTVFGLYDFSQKRLSLEDLIEVSDIPTLHFIPETPALTQLDRDIGSMDFREHWLDKEVITPLKSKYDLIVIDCSPNWNNLITNALIASDLIISPLECKIKHFRNYPYFKVHIEAFLKKTGMRAKHLYVATKHVQAKKLSKDIKNWYLKNVPNCLATTIRESARAEEACAKFLSVPEHVPSDTVAQEMREFVGEVWEHLSVKEADLTVGKIKPAVEIYQG
jgi:chromosome partitioning protein